MSRLLDELSLHTVCREALCPNMGECFARGTATFLLLGPECTRNCGFCNVRPGRPAPPDRDEPEKIALAVREMGLDFVVLTMVTRDDLPDGGATQMARTIAAARRLSPNIRLEVLISDLGGDRESLEIILNAAPEVLNHNIETVSRLYPAVRPQADYRRSLAVLAQASRFDPRPVVKSGLMLGLGETRPETITVLQDLRAAGCRAITMGQYLAPSAAHLPIARYVHPDEFLSLAREAEKIGFTGIAAGPLVRSSYQAALLFDKTRALEGQAFILTPN
ncbi:MAG: lipoyl synthase [Pseudomonadota bacterium]